MALVAAIIAAYAQLAGFEFVNFDDPEYVVDNPHVRGGLTIKGFLWAFRSGDAANWIPVTWLSHMLDCQLFGLQSGWHHLTNVWLHALTTVLLFTFLKRATQARWRSGFVAFVFALHPLHVESVAWIAERKDVLCAFFWVLTLWAYLRFTERPSTRRYAPALSSFVLALLAKPMAVTLPFVLLLLDFWPLLRLEIRGREALREKLPFFGLSALVAVVTYLVQHGSGAVQALSPFPIGLRGENALVSYAVYVGKMFWPSGLSVFYPYPRQLPVWEVLSSALLIVGISAFALRFRRACPYLAVGWLWYLGTLVPVVGLVQVGVQARADRYTYIPLIGLSIMLAWGVADLVRRWQRVRTAALVLAGGSYACCFALTAAQVRHWQNSESLFRQALAVTQDNYVAEHNLGVALSPNPARLPEAIEHLRKAIRIEPASARARTDLGNALANTPAGLEDAVAEYRAALRIQPDTAITHNDLGNTLLRMAGHETEAISEYKAALRLNPDYAEAHNNLGSAFAEMGQLPEAIAEYQTALHLKPDYLEARNNLTRASGKDPSHEPDANAAGTTTPQGSPESAAAHYNRGVTLAKTSDRLTEAIAEYHEALRLRPDYPEAENNMGVAFSQIPGRLPDAIEHFEAALRLRPVYFDAHFNLAIALSNFPDRVPAAMQHFEAALRLKPDPEAQRLLDQLRATRR